MGVAPATTSGGGAQPEMSTLDRLLARYAHALATYTTDPDALLTVLLARDGIAAALADGSPPSVAHAHHLASLDAQLRKAAQAQPPDLARWRASLQPPASAWWWHLDTQTSAEAEQREWQRDLPWVILTGILLTLTLPLTLEIIRRLWAGAPDSVSVVGTLLTLLLTGSPLTRRGQELATAVLARLRLRPTLHAEVVAGAATLAFVVVLLVRLVGMPLLARAYNNQGYAALAARNITEARQHFQRSTALNPDAVVPYFNLGDAYADIGLRDEALSWYRQALERDANFRLTYARLGHQYNQQGDYPAAEQVLLAGLRLEPTGDDPALAAQTTYDLHAQLGWAYFEQEQYGFARKALEAAVALEPPEPQALPHYYLAQVYEALDEPQQASCAWQETVRYRDRKRWEEEHLWLQQATERQEELGECIP